MTLRTVALYFFAAASVSAAFCGCSTTSGQSQLAPIAPNQSREEPSRVRQGAIPASLMIGYQYATVPGAVEVLSKNELGRWRKRAACDASTPAAMSVGSRVDPYPIFIADAYAHMVFECSLVDGRLIRALKSDIHRPYQIAADNVNDVAVLNYTLEGKPRITLFPSGSGDQPIVLSKGLAYPSYAVFDDARDLYVADRDANKIIEYGPGSDQVISTITDGIDQPVALYFGGGGTLWVGNAGAKGGLTTVTGYQAGRQAYLLGFGSRHVPSALLSRGGHLYVTLTDGERHGEVEDYNVAGNTSVFITDGVEHPIALADCAPDICVLNTYGATVTVYASDKLIQTIQDLVLGFPRSMTAEP